MRLLRAQRYQLGPMKRTRVGQVTVSELGERRVVVNQ